MCFYFEIPVLFSWNHSARGESLIFALASYLLNGLVRLQGNVRNIGIHHQREQVEDQVGVSEMEKRWSFPPPLC